jgi:hypothetical protein
MAKWKYANKASCFYLSWENPLLTLSLFVSEMLFFSYLYFSCLDPLCLFFDLLILSLTISVVEKVLNFQLCSSSCCSCSSSTYEKFFELAYSQVNSLIDWLRVHSTGTASLKLFFLLFVLYELNLSVLASLWLYAVWSFARPGVLKFASIDLADLAASVCLQAQFSLSQLMEMLPRSAKAKKNP